MKIAEVEERLTRGDCSLEMLDAFKTALKRVPKKLRGQHCYTTAAAMPGKCRKEAIALIELGLAEYCESWLDRMRAYDNLAGILETGGDWAGAKDAYAAALDAVEPERRGNYAPEYAAHLLRAELHVSGFAYSRELECYAQTADQADEFSRSFQKKRFYRLLAEAVIFDHHGDREKAGAALAKANEMLRPGYEGPLTALLKSKGYIETTGATKEALAFLNRAKIKL